MWKWLPTGPKLIVGTLLTVGGNPVAFHSPIWVKIGQKCCIFHFISILSRVNQFLKPQKRPHFPVCWRDCKNSPKTFTGDKVARYILILWIKYFRCSWIFTQRLRILPHNILLGGNAVFQVSRNFTVIISSFAGSSHVKHSQNIFTLLLWPMEKYSYI